MVIIMKMFLQTTFHDLLTTTINEETGLSVISETFTSENFDRNVSLVPYA